MPMDFRYRVFVDNFTCRSRWFHSSSLRREINNRCQQKEFIEHSYPSITTLDLSAIAWTQNWTSALRSAPSEPPWLRLPIVSRKPLCAIKQHYCSQLPILRKASLNQMTGRFGKKATSFRRSRFYWDRLSLFTAKPQGNTNIAVHRLLACSSPPRQREHLFPQVVFGQFHLIFQNLAALKIGHLRLWL